MVIKSVHPNAPHSAIMAGSHDLRFGGLSLDISYRVGVSCKRVNACFSPHVPYATRSIASHRAQYVKSRVDGQGVHCTKVAVVMSDYLK